MQTHYKCINCVYPRPPHPERYSIDPADVPWSQRLDDYHPVEFTTQSVLNGPVWADPVDTSCLKFNQLDGNVNRVSFTGNYQVVDRRPRNPVGRTGMTGRGSLGRWGPNHAADPIVTRWKRDWKTGEVVRQLDSGQPILQFVAIKRRDTGEWAIPGGMVDAGEQVNTTLKREFGEEALNSLEVGNDQREKIQKLVEEFFETGHEVYKGYVDDPRNTDNSWMETVAVNFHDEMGQSVGRFRLNAGDDAVGVRWQDICGSLDLFASHMDFIRKVVELRNAHW